jgi:hypothetical protein
MITCELTGTRANESPSNVSSDNRCHTRFSARVSQRMQGFVHMLIGAYGHNVHL